MIERTALGNRNHGNRTRHALGEQRGALDRVDGDINFGRIAGTHLLADIQHRRFVLFSFADHHHAIHRHRVERKAHCIDRRLIGGILVATTHEAGGA